MSNYSMKYNIASTAKMLEVEKRKVKEWANIFAEYLSPEDKFNTEGGRQFTISDLRVFANVLSYWEVDPDIENIKIGLNTQSYFECNAINDFITEITPLFRDMPENIDETWRGVVFGGEYGLDDIFTTAESYKLAGDKLVEIGYENYEERELFQPVIYNYRHATELYIKSIIGEEKNHNLNRLFFKLKEILKSKFNSVPPAWFENIINAFHDSDPFGTAFRYGISFQKSELFVDMMHVKTQMGWMADSFKLIKNRLT